MADHGHGGGHGHEEEKEGPRVGIRWFVLAAALIAGIFLLSKCERREGGDGQQAERPAASAPAAAPAPVGYCVNVPNQRFTAPNQGWTEDFPVETGCRVMMDESVLRHLRIQCRDEGDTSYRNQTGNDCNGDYRRFQSKLDRPVSGLMIFRPW